MDQKESVIDFLKALDIDYEIHEHEPLPTIEIAMEVWKSIESTHCKNLFFRNHKGNQHYLVILESNQKLDIHDLEKRLKQGKISFASPKRMQKYLGIEPGSVSPFGLINDVENHTRVFVDKALQDTDYVTFLPNAHDAILKISTKDFIRLLEASGNAWEFFELR